ncbi:hypothetical protein Tco_0220705, partial [Tanacetum coccineum]
MRPFGCPVTILNTLNHLGKFNGKADEGFFVGYSVNRSGQEWLFDIDTLTKSMIYKPIIAGNQTNCNAGAKEDDKVANDVEKKTTKDPTKEDDKDDQDLREFERLIVQGKETEININSTNSIYTASLLINFDGLSYFNDNLPDDPKMPNLEDTGIFGSAYDD